MCYCQPGVTGNKCDQCLAFYSLLSSSGCQPCTGCENSLVLNLSLVDATITTLQQNSSLFLLLMMVDLASNSIINSSLSEMDMIRLMLLQNLYNIATGFNELNGTALNSLDLFSSRTEDEVSAY